MKEHQTRAQIKSLLAETMVAAEQVMADKGVYDPEMLRALNRYRERYLAETGAKYGQSDEGMLRWYNELAEDEKEKPQE